MTSFIVVSTSYISARNDRDACTLAATLAVNARLRVALAPNILHHGAVSGSSGCGGKLLSILTGIETTVFAPRAKLKLDMLTLRTLLPDKRFTSWLPYLQHLNLVQPPNLLVDAEKLGSGGEFSFEKDILQPIFCALARSLESFSFSFAPSLLHSYSTELLFPLLSDTLPYLQNLSLAGCGLKTINFAQLTGCRALRSISLRNNMLGGSASALGFGCLKQTFTKLRVLDVSSNRIVGPLPFACLPTSIVSVNYSFNWLSGEFDDQAVLGNIRAEDGHSEIFLPMLTSLSANNNNLSGCPVGLASLHESMPALRLLLLHSNDFCGSLAAHFGDNDVVLPENLERLSLYGSRLSGKFPSKFFLDRRSAPRLQQLTITNSEFSSIDSDSVFFSIPSTLELLSFDKNLLSQSLMPPLRFRDRGDNEAQAMSLKFLYLSDCGLRGIVDLRGFKEKFPVIDTLHVNGNKVERVITSSAASFAADLPPTLKYFDCSNNVISAIGPTIEVPEATEQAEADAVVDLRIFPPQLQSFNCAQNRLRGTLLLGSEEHPSAVAVLNFSDNALTKLDVAPALWKKGNVTTFYMNGNSELKLVGGAGGGGDARLDVSEMTSVKRLDLGGTKIACRGFPQLRQQFVFLNFGAIDDPEQKRNVEQMLTERIEEHKLSGGGIFTPPVVASAWQKLGIEIGYTWRDDDETS